MGHGEADYYVRYLEAIHDCVGDGEKVNISLQTAPHPKETAKRWYDAGMRLRTRRTSRSGTPSGSGWICPGKETYVGRDEWIKRTIDMVDILGTGQHTIRASSPASDGEAVWLQDCRRGGQEHDRGPSLPDVAGVNPRPISWLPEPLASLGRQERPPLEYYIRIDQAWYELWKEYRYPDSLGCQFGQGVGKSTYVNNASRDMGE